MAGDDKREPILTEIHALIGKVSGDARLSQCLVDGLALAKRGGNGQIADFCSRELAAYYVRDGETWPQWRVTESLKIPDFIEINTYTVHSTEQAIIDQLLSDLSHLNAKLTGDYWVPSIPDTEDVVRQTDDNDNGVRLMIRKLPAYIYSDNPDFKDVTLKVITPSTSIRSVLRATRREFLGRLLEWEKHTPMEPINPDPPKTEPAMPTQHINIKQFRGTLGNVSASNYQSGDHNTIQQGEDKDKKEGLWKGLLKWAGENVGKLVVSTVGAILLALIANFLNRRWGIDLTHWLGKKD